MQKHFWHPYFAPDEGAGAGSGTTENSAGSAASSQSGQTAASAGVTSGRVTSGTATEAMIKAAEAASSAEQTAGAASAAKPASSAGQEASGQPNAAATGQEQAGDAQSQGTNEEQAITGPVPPDRHIAAVKNARAEGAKETAAKYEKSFGWVRELGKPSQIKAAVGLSQAMAEHGPGTFAIGLLRELQASGEDIRPLLAEFTGGSGQGNTNSGPTGDERYPEADLVSNSGKKAYSAETLQNALGILEARLRKEFTKNLTPLQRANEERNTQARDAQQQARAAKMTADNMTMFRQQQHWPTKDGKPDPEGEKVIASYVLAIPQERRQAIGAVACFWEAFNRYKAEKVYPTLGSQARQQVRDENSRKAAASVGAHPSGSGNEGKRPVLKDGDVNGLAKRMEELASAGVGS